MSKGAGLVDKMPDTVNLSRLIRTKRENKLKYLFSHFFAVPQKVL